MSGSRRVLLSAGLALVLFLAPLPAVRAWTTPHIGLGPNTSRAIAATSPLSVGQAPARGPRTSLRLALLPAKKQPPAVGEPLPRIVCPEGYQAYVYANNLTSPHGLALDPDGVLYVSEERAGRVSRIDPDGTVIPVVKGLDAPEGIAFDPTGNLYVVEDVEAGRLLRMDPDGGQKVLANRLDAPEGAVWSPDGHLYVTQSNAQFAVNLPWDVLTRVTRIASDGAVTDIVTDTVLFSYSGLALGADGLLYVANEASNVATTHSIFRVNPATGTRDLFSAGLTRPEGLHFSAGGDFPLFVTEEELPDGQGRLSRVQADGLHAPFCTGFNLVEGVAVDQLGNIYVVEDSAGLIVQILAPDQPPAPPQGLVVEPPNWTSSNDFSLSWDNPPDQSGVAGAYVKIGSPPSTSDDGTLYREPEITQVSGITVSQAGSHAVYVWLQDGAGNADPANAAVATLHYDPDPPGSPLGLKVEPDDWSPVDSFALAWDNPSELSEVITACYRLDTPPLDGADFDACQRVDTAHRGSIDGVPVFEAGSHRAHLWLTDAAGNVDLSTAVTATLRFDPLPPESAVRAPAETETAPIRVDWEASDLHSGARSVTLWVRREEGPWQESGLPLAVGASGSGFFLYEPSGAGAYYFATVATDWAGNTEPAPTGGGEAQTRCLTGQRVYLPVRWKE